MRRGLLLLALLCVPSLADAAICYVRPGGPFGTGSGTTYANAKGLPSACIGQVVSGDTILVWGNPYDQPYELNSGTIWVITSPNGVTLRGATASEDLAAGGLGTAQCPWISGFKTVTGWTVADAAGACGPGRRRWKATVTNGQYLRQYNLWERKLSRPSNPCTLDAKGRPLFLETNYLPGDYHRGTAIPPSDNSVLSGKTNVNAPGEWTGSNTGEVDTIYYCPQGAEDVNTVVV
jgi:hypothetical protein